MYPARITPWRECRKCCLINKGHVDLRSRAPSLEMERLLPSNLATVSTREFAFSVFNEAIFARVGVASPVRRYSVKPKGMKQ